MGAAHFTLRCGRQLGDGSTGAPAYQLPLVALVCNFGSAALASNSIHSSDSLLESQFVMHTQCCKGFSVSLSYGADCLLWCT